MLPTQVVRHEAEYVKPFPRQPGLRECPGTSPASPGSVDRAVLQV